MSLGTFTPHLFGTVGNLWDCERSSRLKTHQVSSRSALAFFASSVDRQTVGPGERRPVDMHRYSVANGFPLFVAKINTHRLSFGLVLQRLAESGLAALVDLEHYMAPVRAFKTSLFASDFGAELPVGWWLWALDWRWV